MARDDDNDLYDEEFDFVDDDEDSELDDESPLDDEARDEDSERDDPDEREEGDARDNADRREQRRVDPDVGGPADDERVDEYGRPEPAANYVVHVYEHKKFTRTIDRPFTPEDAEAFATEFNRTGKSYGRVAVSGKSDAKPKKALE